MRRVTRRQIVRALRAPAPEPPANLERRIKEQIPEDLFAARAAAPATARRSRARTPLALAASVLVAIGSGYLAVRLFEEERLLEDEPRGALTSEARLDASATSESNPGESDRRGRGDQDPGETAPQIARSFEPPPEDRDEAGAHRALPATSRPLAPAASAAQPDVAEAPIARRGPDSLPADRVAAPARVPQALGAAAAGARDAAREKDDRSAMESEDRARIRNEDLQRENQSIEAQNEKIRELEEEKRGLEREMAALPGSSAVAEPAIGEREGAAPAQEAQEAHEHSPAPRVKWYVERRQEIQRRIATLRSESHAAAGADARSAARDAETDRGAYLDVATHSISRLAVTSGGRSLTVVLEDRPDSAVMVPLEEILDASIATRAPSPRRAIEVEGTPTRTPGHVALLVSAEVAESPAHDAASGPPSSIEVELDAAATTRYRLLASHAHALAAAPAGDANAAEAPVYRLIALYEIELARDRSPGAALGAVRLRHGDSAADPTDSTRRSIGAADLAAGWDDARAGLRLAVLGAELALLPPDASWLLLAPIERELERLLADPNPDREVERLAAELEAMASRAAGPADTTPRQPAAAPARSDG